MLEKKIDELGEYFDSILRLADGYNGVRVIIPRNWTLYAREIEGVSITPVEVVDNGLNKVIFVAEPSVKVVEIMDFVKEVIQNNQQGEAKKILFDAKMNELSEIFKTNPISKLETLTFKFQKYNKKGKKDVVVIEEPNIDPQIENEDDIEALVLEAINSTNKQK